jgi:hypothetical protein
VPPTQIARYEHPPLPIGKHRTPARGSTLLCVVKVLPAVLADQ